VGTPVRVVAAYVSAMLLRMTTRRRIMLDFGAVAPRMPTTGLVFAWLILGVAALAAEPRELTGFGSNPGNLRMFSYAPAGLPPAAPLVVLLHGCKQRAASFARDSGFLSACRAGEVRSAAARAEGAADPSLRRLHFSLDAGVV
jgi:hypothetical protein